MNQSTNGNRRHLKVKVPKTLLRRWILSHIHFPNRSHLWRNNFAFGAPIEFLVRFITYLHFGLREEYRRDQTFFMSVNSIESNVK
jgi:hypothetical protein